MDTFDDSEAFFQLHNSSSEEEEEEVEDIRAGKRQPYFSTNLLFGSNLTLADIEITEYSGNDVLDLEYQLFLSQNDVDFQVEVLEPKARLRELRKRRQADTMVDYDQIPELVEKA